MSGQDVAVALIHRDSRLFLQRRPPWAARFPCLWEFPGGKVEPHEKPDEGLRRELQEELGWSPAAILRLPPLDHAYEGFSVRLHPFLCQGRGPLDYADGWGWFTPEESLRLPLPGATRVLLERLKYPLK